MLNQEKANKITEYLSKDIENTKKLLEKEPSVVVAELNAAGVDCSVDELVEYGKELSNAVEAAQRDELDENTLNQVAGGVVITAGLVLGLAGCLVAGAAVGAVAVTGTYHIVKNGW